MSRVYARKFDHDDARARFAAGEKVADLAKRYGVSWAAVARVVDPDVQAKMKQAARRFRDKGRCDACGGPMSGVSRSRGSRYCVPCASLRRATSVRLTSLFCSTCREWKPDNAFPHNHNNISRRGRHSQCRTCNTKYRQAYREAHKQPALPHHP